MTLFAEAGAGGGRRKRSSSLRAKTNQAKRDAAADAAKQVVPPPAATTGPMTLSPTAQKVFDEIEQQWELTAPVRALLRIACEALTKAEQADAVTAAQGVTIPDAKGAHKPHPAAVLAHNSRTLAATTLQRVLSSLGG